jgi:hypothetical protein
MPRDRGGAGPPKRARPAGQGRVASLENVSYRRQDNPAQLRNQARRPSPAVLRTGRAFLAPRRGGR